MRRLFPLLLAWLTLALGALAPAHADQVVDPGIFGINIGLDPTLAGNRPPNFVRHIRTLASDNSATTNATFWKILNPSSGTFVWATADNILGQIASWNVDSIFVLTNPATWVASPVTNYVMSSGAQLNAYTAYVTAFAAHYATTGYPKYVELTNEFNLASAYSGAIPAANMVAGAKAAYSLLSPAHIVLAPSLTATTSGGAGVPDSGWYQYQQLLAGCAPATPATCFDDRDFHWYVNSLFMTNANPAVKFAPELIENDLNQELAVATEQGFASVPVFGDEGFCGDPGAGAAVAGVVNTDQWAGDQFKCLMLLSAFSPALAGIDTFSHGTNAADQTTQGNTQGAVNGLDSTGRALRTATNLLIGATWSGTPVNNSYIQRAADPNQIRQQGDGLGAAVGIVSGTGAGCPSPGAGGGSLPSTMSASNPASAAGASIIVTAIDTTNHTITERECGNITANGSGTVTLALKFDSVGAAIANGQTINLAYCQTMTAGSMANIQYIEPTISETTSGGGFLALTNDAYAFPALGQKLCYQLRTVTSGGGTVAFAVPLENDVIYYNGNGTTGTLPFDITRTFSTIAEDAGVIWYGNFYKPSNGCTYTVAWTADGSSRQMATSQANQMTMYGESSPIAGGLVTLGAAPSILWSCPDIAHSYFLSANGNDGAVCSFAAPCLTPGRADALMGAGGSNFTTTYFMPGTYPTLSASWTCHSGETWIGWPGSVNLTVSSNNICGASTVAGVSFNRINVTGIANSGNLVGWFGNTGMTWVNSTLAVTGAEQVMSIFNWGNILLAGLNISAPTNNGLDAISVPNNDVSDHSGFIFQDSAVNGSDRVAFEQTSLTGHNVSNLNVARVTFTNYGGGINGDGNAIECMTLGGSGGAGDVNNVAYRINCLLPPTGNTIVAGIELTLAGISVTFNDIEYAGYSLPIAKLPNSEIEFNTIKINTANTAANTTGPSSFSPDGLYNATENINTNYIIGPSWNAVNGCGGNAFPPAAPGFCGLTSPPSYVAPLTLNTPRPLWGG